MHTLYDEYQYRSLYVQPPGIASSESLARPRRPPVPDTGRTPTGTCSGFGTWVLRGVGGRRGGSSGSPWRRLQSYGYGRTCYYGTTRSSERHKVSGISCQISGQHWRRS